MISRLLIGLVPALVALAFVAGTPAASAAGAATVSAQATSHTGKTAKHALHEEAEIGSLSGRTDDRNEDDRLVRVTSAIRWPLHNMQRGGLRLNHAPAQTHPPCAHPPRGPPTT